MNLNSPLLLLKNKDMEEQNVQDPVQQAHEQARIAAEQAQAAAEAQVKQMQKDLPKQMAIGAAKSMAEQELNKVVSHALPDEVNRLRWTGARALPIIGPILQWIGNIRWIAGIFGKKE